jgi:hypothetical protein
MVKEVGYDKIINKVFLPFSSVQKLKEDSSEFEQTTNIYP